MLYHSFSETYNKTYAELERFVDSSKADLEVSKNARKEYNEVLEEIEELEKEREEFESSEFILNSIRENKEKIEKFGGNEELVKGLIIENKALESIFKKLINKERLPLVMEDNDTLIKTYNTLIDCSEELENFTLKRSGLRNADYTEIINDLKKDINSLKDKIYEVEVGNKVVNKIRKYLEKDNKNISYEYIKYGQLPDKLNFLVEKADLLLEKSQDFCPHEIVALFDDGYYCCLECGKIGRIINFFQKEILEDTDKYIIYFNKNCDNIVDNLFYKCRSLIDEGYDKKEIVDEINDMIEKDENIKRRVKK